MVEDKELMSIALNGLYLSWLPFVQIVCAYENLTYFVNICDNNVQDRLGWRHGQPNNRK